MPTRRLALCVGAGALDPALYEWVDPTPDGPRRDAQNVADVLGRPAHRYGTTVLRDPASSALVDAVADAVASLESGDELVFYFAGHGGRVPAHATVPDDPGREASSHRNVLCVHDGLVLDLDLRAIWRRARPGARLIAIMDCCYAETSTTMLLSTHVVPAPPSAIPPQAAATPCRVRAAPDDAVSRVVRRDAAAWSAREQDAMARLQDGPTTGFASRSPTPHCGSSSSGYW